jgi:predicted RecA/RadA family phage recombinase
MAVYAPNFFPGDRFTLTAGANITAGQLLYISAANTASPTTAATGAWIGVAAFDALSGAAVTVLTEGVHTIAASGAIAAGAAVVAAAAGAVATVGADASDGANLVGVALTAAASNLVTIAIR